MSEGQNSFRKDHRGVTTILNWGQSVIVKDFKLICQNAGTFVFHI